MLQAIQDYVNKTDCQNIRPTVKERGLGESQTQKCVLKTVSNSKLKLRVIDTPGLGDTNGIEKDEQNVEEIFKCLRKLSQLSAICIVLKRGANRNTARLRYIVNEACSILN